MHQKYKFMETNLMARKRRLKGQLPDISSSLALIGKLRAKRDAEEDTNTQFLLSDSVYANATIPPTDKVSKSVVLWGEIFREIDYLFSYLLSRHFVTALRQTIFRKISVKLTFLQKLHYKLISRDIFQMTTIISYSLFPWKIFLLKNAIFQFNFRFVFG